ncbi:unnamed protein product [Sphagnum troendelagicum]|uniref:CAAX amino terminal protease n=1 Tax=Sphagnum troendelagicum TaxID=128251 RepID=A0ABP0UCT0_9BRYO
MALQEIQIAGKLQLGFLCPRKRRAAPSCKHHHHHHHCMPNSSSYYPSSYSSFSSSSRRKRERLHKSDRREELLGLEFAAAEDCRGFAVLATNHRARVSAIVRSAGVLSSHQFRSSSIGNNNRGLSSSSLHQSSSLRRRFAGLGSEVQAVEALDLQQVGGGDEVLKLGEFLWTAALSGIHSFSGLYILAAAFVFAGGGAVAALAAREREEEKEVQQQLLLGFEDSLLISQPTPFNRFVYGRCPSMFSPGAAAAAVADVQAPLHMGKKRRKKKKQTKDQEEINRVEYQRTCLVAHDSGVVSLDWPMQLEFAADNGFDNTLLLIPGTTEGSGDQGIQRFVIQAACCGYFPIVLNPRGCAASPLTTPRIFTAADSDDVHLAVHHISRTRPQSTLLVIGWGFGANMLAKYLGEDSAATPVMAAVCISNPFNLEEMSRYLARTRDGELDRAFTKGLVDILAANKMLFVGGKSGFDVERGLAATSLREFETAISRVAYGFETLDNFYANASSASVIEDIQVPLLCIQGEDDVLPMVSLPRVALEKNPFTTTLVAFPSKSSTISGGNDARQFGSASPLHWSHSVAFEWLAAVEVALLKGRHPLLEYSVNLAVKSTNDNWHLDTVAQEKSGSDVAEDNSSHQLDVKTNDLGKDAATSIPEKKDETRDATATTLEDGKEATTETSKAAAVESSPPEEAGEPEEGSEAFRMRTAAESIMNVLDITMPGTLSNEKKQQVLDAVGRGQTIVSAFQEAVPEDVRGNMAAAVSGAVQARGISFNLVGFGSSMPPPSLPAGLTEKIQEKLAAVAGGKKDAASGPSLFLSSDDMHGTPLTGSVEHDKPNQGSSDPEKGNHKGTENRGSDDPTSNGTGKSKAEENGSVMAGSSESKKAIPGKPEDVEVHANEGAKASATEVNKDAEIDHTKPDAKKDMKQSEDKGGPKSLEGNPQEKVVPSSGGERKEGGEKQDSSEEPPNGGNQGSKDKLKSVKSDEHSEHKEAAENKERTQTSEGNAKSEAGDSTDPTSPKGEQKKPEESPEAKDKAQSVKDVEAPLENPTPPPPPPPPTTTTDTAAAAPSPPAGPVMGPSLDVGLALQALTGFDDSTQMAVTNVFGVVENMLDQMETERKAAETADQPSPKSEGNGKEIEGEKRDLGKDDLKPKEAEKSEDGTSHKTPKTVKSESMNTEDADSTQEEDEPDSKDALRDGGKMAKYEKVVDEDAMERKHGKKGSGDGENWSAQHHRPLDFPMMNTGGSEKVPVQSVQSLSGQLNPRGNQGTLVSGDAEKAQTSIAEESVLQEKSSQSCQRSEPAHNGAAVLQSGNDRDSNQPLSSRKGSAEDDTQEGQDNRGGADGMVSSGEEPEMKIEMLSLEIDQEYKKEKEEAEDAAPRRESSHQLQVTSNGEDKGKPTTDEPNTVKNVIVNALKLEVLRRLGVAGMEAMGVDLEQEVANVANAVVQAVQGGKHESGQVAAFAGDGEPGAYQSGQKLGILQGESVVRALGSVLGSTQILGGLVPLGVLVGVVLAALGALYIVVSGDQDDAKEKNTDSSSGEEEEEDDNDSSMHRGEDDLGMTSQRSGEKKIEEEADGQGERNLMGAMAAAMSGTAMLASFGADHAGGQNEELLPLDAEKTGTSTVEKPNLVTTFAPLAEKAMSVAAPVVPQTEDGEIDHERLVAMLAELGQRGGLFRLVGKVALLWGGLRGAMSLTDRLLVFLHIQERALHQRLAGFAAMSLVLWAPVLVPLLPSLLQQWATKVHNGVSETASVLGLYGAVLILITIWGKRVRGYEKPLLQYGLRLFSRKKLQDVARGIAVGAALVTMLYSTNAVLGYVQFRWASLLATNIRFGGMAMRISKILVQALGMGFAVALVEEILFRAWLQDEIAVDFGFHKSVFLSALVFSLTHWSPPAMPGLWFLSIALAGARARMNGNLALPIGLHAGLIAANYVITVGGLAHFAPHAPAWFTGAHAGNPLAGTLGMGLMAMLAVVLYPRAGLQAAPVTNTTTNILSVEKSNTEFSSVIVE